MIKKNKSNLPLSLLDAVLSLLSAVLLFISPSLQTQQIWWLSLLYYLAGAFVSLIAIIMVVKIVVIIYLRLNPREYKDNSDNKEVANKE